MSDKYLWRYTDLPALIYLLNEHKLTFLDPLWNWDDGNDTYYLSLYRKKKRLKSLLVVCFTQAKETYHHWRVFAPGSGGVCIKFIRTKLLKAVKKQSGIRLEPVKYLKVSELRDLKLKVHDLPFRKRYGYEQENEFRMIYENESELVPKLDIDISLSSIERVILSPWIHPDLSDHVNETIRSIRGCSKLSIVRSTLIGNKEWKRLGKDAV